MFWSAANMEFNHSTDSYDDDSTASEAVPIDDVKEPLSPPSGAESLFLAGLTASRLSASVVSEQVKINHRQRTQSMDSFASFASFRSVPSSTRSAATDDFMSCVGSQNDLDELLLLDDLNSQQHQSRFFKILEHEAEGADDTHDDIDTNDNMATTYVNSKYATSPATKAPLKSTTSSTSSSAEEGMKVDAAETVYGKAKDIWAWGKTVPVVSFFVGTTEKVASKALGVAGTDFGTLDSKIAAELAKLDAGVLNPAIEAIVKAVVNAAGKSEGTLKPFIISILKPLGMIKSEADESNPEAHTDTPEVTAKK
jgi:hypothetical protein